jgi:hypothetical protein
MLREVLSMQKETKGKIKFGAWGLVYGALITMITGFAWGGWTTAGQAKTMTGEAVLVSQTAICVAQFMQSPNHEEQLKKFGTLNRWSKAEFIEKGGWDKMPGQEKADYAVTRACTEGLKLLIKK